MSSLHRVQIFLILCMLFAPGESPGVQKLSRPEPNNPVTPQALTDAWLRGKIEMALLMSPYLDSIGISTKVTNHRVLLSGFVKSPMDRYLAQQIALAISGVHTVDNQLKVGSDTWIPDESQPISRIERLRDITLNARIKNRLILDRHVNAEHIYVDTRHQVVTLRGTVTSTQELKLALQVAKQTEDVKSVRDELSVLQAN